jgi:anaerobic magnesium-protoporphyrin IX monomethyl ester cyclase
MGLSIGDLRIALVNPPQKLLVDPGAYPPVGLGYLTAILRKCDYYCDLLDLQGATQDEALALLASYNVVGYTAVTPYYADTLQLAKANARPGVWQIIGGPHATITREKDPVFCSAVLGPGELSIQRFLLDLLAGDEPKSFYELPGLPLDELPHPICEAGKRLNFKGEPRTAVIFTSRGCTHKCAFCAARSVYPRIAFRDVQDVALEVAEWVEKGVRTFRFMDDGLTMSKPRSVKLFQALMPLRVKWACMVRADQVDPPLLALMKSAGCTEVAFGVESFDPNVLRALDKECDIKQNILAVQQSHEAGLYVHVFLMMSTPGETYLTTPKLNIDNMEALRGKFDKLLYSTFMPHLGTPIAKNPRAYGIRIVETDHSKYTQHQFVKKDGRVVEVPLWSPIRIDGMTWEQQLENLQMMDRYVKTLPQLGKGNFS